METLGGYVMTKKYIKNELWSWPETESDKWRFCIKRMDMNSYINVIDVRENKKEIQEIFVKSNLIQKQKTIKIQI